MYRTSKLVVRLNEAEHEAIRRLAQTERMPASTLVRRLLLREVDRRGLWPPADAHDATRTQTGEGGEEL
jgi:hypothetical protein